MPSSRHRPLVSLALLLAAGVLFCRWTPPPVSFAGMRNGPRTGRVLDVDGVPVAGALVRRQGTTTAVLSREDGTFVLPRSPRGRVTAWRNGYFIAGADNDSDLSLRLKRLPAEDDEQYAWVHPAADAGHPRACGKCHEEIYREWAASPHARGNANPRLRNYYEGTDVHGRAGVGWGLLPEHPDGAGVCNSCHLPTISLAGEAMFDLRLARGVPALGVHCDYCHKVRELGEGKIGLAHGRFLLDLLRPRQGQLFLGPLDDVPGEDTRAEVFRDSRFCAACHEGILFGVPVYTTYSEWKDSPAGRQGRTCQDCHMAPSGRMSNMAPGHGGIERDPKTLASHRMDDADRREMLRRALRADVQVSREDGAVRVDVAVWTEGVGHRTPTGFIDRHLVVTVEATAAGRPVASRTGPRLPPEAGAEVAGLAGRLHGRTLRGYDGRVPAPFWRADPAGQDTRLQPGVPDRWSAVFPGEAEQVTLRIVARRFWPEVAREKGWPENETEVIRLERLVPGAVTNSQSSAVRNGRRTGSE